MTEVIVTDDEIVGWLGGQDIAVPIPLLPSLDATDRAMMAAAAVRGVRSAAVRGAGDGADPTVLLDRVYDGAGDDGVVMLANHAPDRPGVFIGAVLTVTRAGNGQAVLGVIAPTGVHRLNRVSEAEAVQTMVDTVAAAVADTGREGLALGLVTSTPGDYRSLQVVDGRVRAAQLTVDDAGLPDLVAGDGTAQVDAVVAGLLDAVAGVGRVAR